MPVDPNPTMRRRRLGAELHRLREAAGLTAEEVAAHIENHPSKISRIEHGRSGLRQRDLRDILDLFGVTDERRRNSLLSLARNSNEKGWWHQHKDVLTSAYSDLIDLESDAAGMLSFEALLVPGLLQTADYARAVAGAVPVLAPRDVEEFVSVRMARQEVLTKPEPLELWMILTEAALRQPMGGREVMRTQLRHLTEAAQKDNVTLQVLPYAVGAHAGINGPFTVLEFPELTDQDVVLVENLASSLYLEEEQEIRWYKLVFNHLRMTALPAADSVELINQVTKEL